MPDYDPKSIPILDDVIEAGIIDEADAEDKLRSPIADITDMEDELAVDDGSINLFSTAPVELSPDDVIIEDGATDNSHTDDFDADDSGPSIGTIDSLEDSLDDLAADAADVTRPVNTEDEDSSSYPAIAVIEDADLEENEAGHVEEEPFSSALIDYHHDADAAELADDQIVSGTTLAEDEPQAETGEVSDSEVEPTKAPIEDHAVQATHATQATIALAVDEIVDDVVNDIVNQLLPDLQQQLKYLVKQALEDRLPAEIIGQEEADTDQNST